VAVGDEEGHVRLLDSDKGARFAGVFLAFRPHTNAIIDMSFSQDDSLLATASGDQTGLVVDMTTRSTVAVLAQHTASLKQVKFQPGAASNSIIATSSRDGSVHLWDLRCTGATGPVLNVQVSLDPSAPASISRPRVPKFGCVVNSIIDAHRPFSSSRASRQMSIKETALRADVPDRFGDVSVTAISFLPEGRENFLLTASEANATIKLWDLRSLHTNKRKPALPVSYTAQPDSHNQWRHFGINSINLSGDGARLYALCRDSTVYTYSTNYLVLGHMPKLSAKPLLRRQPADVIEAPGPLYGFRHPQLHATSFYVKSAVRPARAGKAEMLAVGSCDGCAVLFPTDEKYLLRTQQATESRLPIMSSLSSTQSAAASRVTDTTPISERGTSLIRGHDREVGALSWTAAGELITVGDDFLVRCWREDDAARELRVNGEQGGQRWGCGWASMSSDYDDDEDE
jgi:WD40 repeat protein